MWQLCEVLLKLKGYVIPLHHPFHFSSTPKTAHRKLFNCSCLIIVSEDFLSRHQHHSYRLMENYSHFCGCTHSGAIKRDLYICWKDQHNEIMNAFRSLIPLPYFSPRFFFLYITECRCVPFQKLASTQLLLSPPAVKNKNSISDSACTWVWVRWYSCKWIAHIVGT